MLGKKLDDGFGTALPGGVRWLTIILVEYEAR